MTEKLSVQWNSRLIYCMQKIKYKAKWIIKEMHGDKQIEIEFKIMQYRLFTNFLKIEMESNLHEVNYKNTHLYETG